MKKKTVVIIIIVISLLLACIGASILVLSLKSSEVLDNNKASNKIVNKEVEKDDNPPLSIENDNKPAINTNEDTFVTKNGFTGYVKDGITYIDGIVVVNKTYALPDSYGSGLTKETENAFYEMQKAAQADNIRIFVRSGFRSYIDQRIIYNDYVARDGKDAADRYSARPGHSEHQSGLAVDLNSIDTDFAATPEGKWLHENAYKYGFILRYTKDGEDETGYMYEPWHYRYVGVELAKLLYNEGNWITLERYLGIISKYE